MLWESLTVFKIIILKLDCGYFTEEITFCRRDKVFYAAKSMTQNYASIFVYAFYISTHIFLKCLNCSHLCQGLLYYWEFLEYDQMLKGFHIGEFFSI